MLPPPARCKAAFGVGTEPAVSHLSCGRVLGAQACHPLAADHTPLTVPVPGLNYKAQPPPLWGRLGPRGMAPQASMDAGILMTATGREGQLVGTATPTCPCPGPRAMATGPHRRGPYQQGRGCYSPCFTASVVPHVSEGPRESPGLGLGELAGVGGSGVNVGAGWG